MSETTPQQMAERVRDGMLKNDRATRAMGMQVVDISPGRATVTMRVREDMLNGHDTCHGGLISTLADSAFAFACNSHGELTVAASITVDFLAPGRKDDLLTAQAHEVSKSGRTGLYDCEVTNQRGEPVASLRCVTVLRNG